MQERAERMHWWKSMMPPSQPASEANIIKDKILVYIHEDHFPNNPQTIHRYRESPIWMSNKDHALFVHIFFKSNRKQPRWLEVHSPPKPPPCDSHPRPFVSIRKKQNIRPVQSDLGRTGHTWFIWNQRHRQKHLAQNHQRPLVSEHWPMRGIWRK